MGEYIFVVSIHIRMTHITQALEKLLDKYWLHRSIPSPPNAIARVPWWKGFSYRKKWSVVPDDVRKRCESLAVAPVWTNVRYAEDTTSHVQAIAQDSTWKKQYLYHPQRNHIRRIGKTEKLLDAKKQLSLLRQWYEWVLHTDAFSLLTKQKALIVALLDETWKRIGSLNTQKSDWIVSLCSKHIQQSSSSISFTYVWKAWKKQHVELLDNELIKFFNELTNWKQWWVLRWDDEHTISSSVIRKQMYAIWSSWSPKDLRMRSWTIAFYEAWKEGMTYKDAIESVADHLWNTVTVSKKYYIPLLLQEAWKSWLLGQREDQVKYTRSTRYLSCNEHRLWKILCHVSN